MSRTPAHDGRTPSVGCTMVGLGVLAAIGAGVFALGALSDGDDGAIPSPPTTTAATATTLPAVATTQPPPEVAVDEAVAVDPDVDEYAITYRTETVSGDAVLIDTEVRRYHFPFRSEVLTFPVEPEDRAGDAGAASDRSAYVMGGFETGTVDEQPTVLTAVPGVPVRLGHFGGDLARAVDEGLVEFIGRRRTITGRECDVYRTRSPIDVVRLQAPTVEDHTELCIAPDGLVLQEIWHTAGELFRRRTAVDIVESPVADEHFELVGFRIPDARGGGRVRRLLPDSTAPGVPHLLPRGVGEEFESLGRYVYVADAVDTDPGNVQVDRIVSLVDVLVSDSDVIVVENGGNVGGDVTAGGDGIAVDVPGHPDAQGRLFAHQSEVFIPADGRFVRLSSSLPLRRLVALAADLEHRPGSGEITPAGDQLDITGRLAPEDLAEHAGEGGGAGEHTHDGSTHRHG